MLAYGSHFWILLVSVACVVDAAVVPAADITTICRRSDPKLDDCVLRSANELRPKLKKGIKSLKIPSLDPMIIPKIHLAQGDGPVSLDSTFNNVRVEGLSTYEIRKVYVDFDRKEIHAEAYVPYLNTDGEYITTGKILSLPINGNGHSSSNYTGVSSFLTLKFKPEIKNGKEYWTLAKSDYDLDVKHAAIHLDNLFNGNKQLGDTMNAFISENWQVVFQELKPTVSDTVNAFITDIVTKVFKAYPLEDLFPE